MRLPHTSVVLALFVTLGALLVAGQAAPKPAPLDKKDPGYVTPKSLTTPWPLTVSEAVLRCQTVPGATPTPRVVTLKTADGKEYAINETAKVRGFLDFDAIVAANPKAPGTKINAMPLIALGHRLCD